MRVSGAVDDERPRPRIIQAVGSLQLWAGKANSLGELIHHLLKTLGRRVQARCPRLLHGFGALKKGISAGPKSLLTSLGRRVRHGMGRVSSVVRRLPASLSRLAGRLVGVALSHFDPPPQKGR